MDFRYFLKIESKFLKLRFLKFEFSTVHLEFSFFVVRWVHLVQNANDLGN